MKGNHSASLFEVLCALALAAAGGSRAVAVSNPVPYIDSLSPLSAAPGGAQFTLTVNGTGFESGISTVEWNGTALATTFVSAEQLTATVPASNIASAGTAAVTVVNFSPGGASNVVYFPVNTFEGSVTFLNASGS